MNEKDISYFYNSDFRLSFSVFGSGEPILLLHGFSSSGYINWYLTGWVNFLSKAGYKVITIDNRGHGKSQKSYHLEDYFLYKMADDAINLLYYLGIFKSHIMGYSMGARILFNIALRSPITIHTIIFGGFSLNMLNNNRDYQNIIHSLLVPDPKLINNNIGLMFRNFADFYKNDRKALATCMKALSKDSFKDIPYKILIPTLLAVGTKDNIAIYPKQLKKYFSNIKLLNLINKNHINAINDIMYKKEVLKFLKCHPL